MNGEKNLSFNKFASLCVEYELFGDEAQDLYIGLDNKTTLKNEFFKMKIEWP